MKAVVLVLILVGGMCLVCGGVLLFMIVLCASYVFWLVALPATVAVESYLTAEERAQHLAAMYAATPDDADAAFYDGDSARSHENFFEIYGANEGGSGERVEGL